MIGLFVFITVKMAAVAVDSPRDHIYWSDHGRHTISRATLDGSNPEVVVNAGEFFIAVFTLSLVS